MFNYKDFEKEIDNTKNKILNMSKEEKILYIRKICVSIAEAEHALISAHRKNKTPIECLNSAYTILTKIDEPKTIH